MTELKTGLNRRKFLNTAGGGILGLPWLESLALAKGSKPAQPAKRMAFYYLPNGITRRGFFMEKVTGHYPSLLAKTMFGVSKAKLFQSETTRLHSLQLSRHSIRCGKRFLLLPDWTEPSSMGPIHTRSALHAFLPV